LDENSPADRVEKIVFDWLHHYDLKPGVLLEKSPPNTIRSLWLQRNFVPARFVAIVRSPFAVVEGIRRRGIGLKVGAEHWRCANQIMLDDLERLEHRILVRYEDLCRDPLAALEGVRRVLDLQQPFAGEMLRTRESSEAPPPLYDVKDHNPSSIARLTPREIGQIARITERVRERLGYEVPC